MKTEFEHIIETVDGVTTHIFYGTTNEADWGDLNAFQAAYPMKFKQIGAGNDRDGGFEECELSTTDADVALLFKLTFGGT
jgi:hypothetical protein